MERSPAPRPVTVPVLAQRTSELLRARVPLTLLIDLSDPAGPRSRELYALERAS